MSDPPIRFRLFAPEGGPWTADAAASLVGKPLTLGQGGRKVGEVLSATLCDDGSIEVEASAPVGTTTVLGLGDLDAVGIGEAAPKPTLADLIETNVGARSEPLTRELAERTELPGT